MTSEELNRQYVLANRLGINVKALAIAWAYGYRGEPTQDSLLEKAANNMKEDLRRSTSKPVESKAFDLPEAFANINRIATEFAEQAATLNASVENQNIKDRLVAQISRVEKQIAEINKSINFYNAIKPYWQNQYASTSGPSHQVAESNMKGIAADRSKAIRAKEELITQLRDLKEVLG